MIQVLNLILPFISLPFSLTLLYVVIKDFKAEIHKETAFTLMFVFAMFALVGVINFGITLMGLIKGELFGFSGHDFARIRTLVVNIMILVGSYLLVRVARKK